jgi:[ribosomal protein S18]-alanine N-acetyltransferase
MSAQPNAIRPTERPIQRPTQQPPERHCAPMTVKHLDAVMPVEAAVYEFPWSRGNFVDSLASGYPACLLLDASGGLLGYFVVMVGVDEWHLLNITVALHHQSQGHGRFLLDHIVSLSRQGGAQQLWLEVRRSNARARAIYARYGFTEIGVRRGYYPASSPASSPATEGREDAVVMRLPLTSEAA